MCGIFAAIVNTNTDIDVEKVVKLLDHRGPDSHNSIVIPAGNQKVVLVHTRLRIVGDNSTQPLSDTTVYLVINGEIFNWRELQAELDYTCTKSDCEILIPLYHRYKDDLETFFNKLDGQFAFVLFDTQRNHILVGRDHIGVCPLYSGYSKNDVFYASEMKAILPFTEKVAIFNPRSFVYNNIRGHFYPEQTYLNFEKYLEHPEQPEPILKARTKINDLLGRSVEKQLRDLLVQDAPDFGVLLSGGLDSSLIASLVTAKIKVKTFSIGISKNAADLVAARRVAKYLGTEHSLQYPISLLTLL